MTIKPLPSQAELVELFDYSIITGELYYKKRVSRRMPVGSRAGSSRRDGYRYISVNKQRYLAHRIIWIMVTGLEPLVNIDHIDGDPSNNAWHNLRDVSQSLNLHNQNKLRVTNSTGFSGVYKKRNRYVAEIWINGKKVNLGTYITAEEASCARETYKAEHINYCS